MGVGRGGSHVPQSGSLPFNAVVARGESTMIYFCPLSSPFLGPLGLRSSRGRRTKVPSPLLREAPLPSRQRHATTAQAAAARGAHSSLPQQEVVPFCPPRGITGLAGKGGETKKGRNGQKRETEQKCFSSITPNWIVPGRRKRKGWMKKEWGGGGERRRRRMSRRQQNFLSLPVVAGEGSLPRRPCKFLGKKEGSRTRNTYFAKCRGRRYQALYCTEEKSRRRQAPKASTSTPLLQGRSPRECTLISNFVCQRLSPESNSFFSGRRQKSGKKGEGRG